jgi:hypothetical protein
VKAVDGATDLRNKFVAGFEDISQFNLKIAWFYVTITLRAPCNLRVQLTNGVDSSNKSTGVKKDSPSFHLINHPWILDLHYPLITLGRSIHPSSCIGVETSIPKVWSSISSDSSFLLYDDSRCQTST